jgi:hypothetical protein
MSCKSPGYRNHAAQSEHASRICGVTCANVDPLARALHRFADQTDLGFGCDDAQGRGQAARTVSRNLPTSSLRRLLSPDSDCAAASTCEEAEPVSPAPRCTSVMLDET